MIASTAYTVILSGSLLVAAGLIAFRAPVAGLVFDDQGRASLVVLLGLMLPAALSGAFFQQIMRVRFQPWRFLVSNLGGAVITIGVPLVLVLALDQGIEGVLVGQIAGFVAAAAYGLWSVRKQLALRFSGAQLRTMLAFGLPFLPAAAAFWVVSVIDRYMLRYLSSLDELGQYAIANRVTSVLPMALLGFTAAYSPFILRLWSEDPDAERVLRGRTLTYMVVLIAFVCVGTSLFAREIIWLIAPNYDNAYRAVGLILVGAGAYGICSITGAGMSITRKTPWLMLFSLFGAAVNVGLNFALIPAWGMLGAAAATAVAYSVISALYYYKGQRLYPTPYDLRKVLGTIALALPACGLGAIAYPTLAFALPLKVAVLTAFSLALVALRIIEPREVRSARDRVRALLSGGTRSGSAQSIP